ncbi:hypothetical protein KIN20_007646 [Parelaphostrongylus tenuis]|uniref:Uncharacterized protein n=1 Tax=Parelaphostrongylus tenuis TaxID=148309 RepID=A0AAD5MPC9_PARTN|nr:hypothetical protein KIN20_007646 [Parelaphostrongylus tenuis]
MISFDGPLIIVRRLNLYDRGTCGGENGTDDDGEGAKHACLPAVLPRMNMYPQLGKDGSQLLLFSVFFLDEQKKRSCQSPVSPVSR